MEINFFVPYDLLRKLYTIFRAQIFCARDASGTVDVENWKCSFSFDSLSNSKSNKKTIL